MQGYADNFIPDPFAHEEVAILHELDLGQHMLFIMSDSSIDLFANDEQTSYLVDNGMSLDSDETYRLFLTLHEQFQRNKPEATDCVSGRTMERGE